ncbi:hypothetical protein NC797_16370 [Aquibacillus sp. 3ASR75-11]|uniref:DUF4367 domain-containing protein n=1 Tax=Terrihalobacillus insolitus TaxID=2950438 RepID=A0A9X3WXI8_9BACI|nr:hypothetical protein [Terrihalobacillus insolitus]MDC3415079.1 hypothetical protein [Terrihalobacillus insolitus]MDC3426076.1 hypothetical protein [Terrihalobacillus insolitus]
MQKLVTKLFLMTMILIVTACSFESEDETLKDVKKVTETEFSSTGVEPNTELEQFSIYIPNNLEIVEKGKSNLILEEGDQSYVVFNNVFEDRASELNYKTASVAENPNLLESFTDDGRFGYVRIIKTDEEEYELQVGIGGIKITTYSPLGSLESDAEMMMKIANSITNTSNKE